MQMDRFNPNGYGDNLADLSAQNCEDSCNQTHLRDAWLRQEDKWYCEDCLAEYFMEELWEVTGLDNLEGFGFIAHTNDADEFTHFVIVGAFSLEITLEQLNEVKGEK